MKPKDLKSLYTWEERRVYIDDGIFHIPSFIQTIKILFFPGGSPFLAIKTKYMWNFAAATGSGSSIKPQVPPY